MKREFILYIVIVGLLLSNIRQYTNKQRITLEYHTTENAEVGDILVLEAIDEDGAIHIVPQDQSNEIISQVPQLIWNADDEGIPAVDGLIKVEQIEGNKYYLVPVND